MPQLSVGVFRLQLFKPSETFIPAQVQKLARYRPVYIGTRLFGDPRDAKLVTMNATKSELLKIYAFRDPRPLLAALGPTRLDIIHAHFGVDGVYAAPLAQSLAVPLVTTLHGFDVTRSDADMLRSLRPALVNGVLFRRDLYRTSRLFLCVSEFIRKAAIARGYPVDRLRVHYIGIDTDRLQAREESGDGGLIVHVGRLVEKKGTRYLLQAFARLKPEFPDARLVIVGDGPLRAALEAEARTLRLGYECSFLGMQPNEETLRWVRKAAIMVVPSITASDGDMEGFGIVNLEAGALGVPVVAFDSGGISEAIRDGETGLLAPEKDVDRLAGQMLELLRDPELRRRLGQSARRNVVKKFDISRQTAKLESHYDELLVGRA